MYSDFLIHQALTRPNAVAVSLRPLDITYGRLEAEINATAAALLEFAIPPRCLVAVDLAGDPYRHWLLTLALDRLGHVSASYASTSDLARLAPGAAITSGSAGVPEGLLAIGLDEAWWAKTLRRRQRIARTPSAGSDAARVVQSSGTTGTPKKTLLTHDNIIRRLSIMSFGRIHRGEKRSHVALRVDTAGGFQGVLLTWWLGGTAILGRVDPRRIVQEQITSLVMSPAQLGALVDQLPAAFTPLPDLEVRVLGSATPAKVSRSARLKLTAELMNRYASTEASTVTNCHFSMTDADPTIAGFLVPWASAEAVSDSGERLAPGETGEIRLRTSTMAYGYLDDEAASAGAFRDGWFYPGDLGSVSETGVLRITGRANEVINIGGVKTTPNAIETIVSDCPGVQDAAAFSAPGEGADQQVWLALVGGDDLDLAAVRRACASLRLGPANLLRVSAIPRNHMGKIDRAALREAASKVRDARRGSETLN